MKTLLSCSSSPLTSLDDFITDYRLSDSYKNDLKTILQDLDDQFTNEDLDKDWDYIENRIKAQIANAIWDKSAMYKVNLYIDTVVIEALQQFPSAQQLLVE